MSDATITLPRFLASDVIAMLEAVASRLVREGARELRDMERAPYLSFDTIFAAPEGEPTAAEAYEAAQAQWIEVTRRRLELIYGSVSMTEAALAHWFRSECASRLATIRAEIAA